MAHKPRINNTIQATELRIISEKGENLGVKSREEALNLAELAGLDLIEIAPTAKPPVARIIDRGKYQYQLDKEARKARKKAHEVEVRGIRVRLGTSARDLIMKAKKAEDFLKEGNRVQVLLALRGREKYLDRNFINKRLQKILESITIPFKVSEQPKKGPRGLLVTLEYDHVKNKQSGTKKTKGDQDGKNLETHAAQKPFQSKSAAN